MLIESRANEVDLRGHVRLPIVLELLGQPTLQRAIFTSHVGVATEVVAKSKLVVKSRRVGGHEVQVVGAMAWIGLAEPVHFIGSIRGVEVSEGGERVEALARGLKIRDADAARSSRNRSGQVASYGTIRTGSSAHRRASSA